MKAIDIITPGDYEVRTYKGGERKAHIVRVEQKDMRIIDPGFYQARTSRQWRAIEEYEHEGETREIDYPLAQVIRPWSLAAPEHDAAAADAAEAERICSKLESILVELGVDVEVFESSKDQISIGSMTRDQALALTNLLRVAGEGRA